MNPYRIWREFGDDALASQIEAGEYGTFVAMPFRNQFSYRADQVFDKVITAAIKKAGEAGLPRLFAVPVRADKMTPNAGEITEHIVEGILYNHFFLADLTMANQGVLIELGAALSLKHSSQIVLICQGDIRDLHFDIKDNRVICYDQGQAIDEIARALADGARAFEARVGDRMEAIRKSLSLNAVYLLNLCGRLRREGGPLLPHALQDDPNYQRYDPLYRQLAFDNGARELQEHGLLELEYMVADDGVRPDKCSYHPTKLGLVFIRQTWPQSFGDLA